MIVEDIDKRIKDAEITNLLKPITLILSQDMYNLLLEDSKVIQGAVIKSVSIYNGLEVAVLTDKEQKFYIRVI